MFLYLNKNYNEIVKPRMAQMVALEITAHESYEKFLTSNKGSGQNKPRVSNSSSYLISTLSLSDKHKTSFHFFMKNRKYFSLH